MRNITRIKHLYPLELFRTIVVVFVLSMFSNCDKGSIPPEQDKRNFELKIINSSGKNLIGLAGEPYKPQDISVELRNFPGNYWKVILDSSNGYLIEMSYEMETDAEYYIKLSGQDTDTLNLSLNRQTSFTQFSFNGKLIKELTYNTWDNNAPLVISAIK